MTTWFNIARACRTVAGFHCRPQRFAGELSMSKRHHGVYSCGFAAGKISGQHGNASEKKGEAKKSKRIERDHVKQHAGHKSGQGESCRERSEEHTSELQS